VTLIARGMMLGLVAIKCLFRLNHFYAYRELDLPSSRYGIGFVSHGDDGWESYDEFPDSVKFSSSESKLPVKDYSLDTVDDEEREDLEREVAHREAHQTYQQAKNLLGGLEGTVKNELEALSLMRIAADRGDCSALLELAHMMDQGIGCTKDAVEAFKNYKEAADLGSSEAMFSVGIRYKLGEGVEQNSEKGDIWLHKAADEGNDCAKMTVALEMVCSIETFGADVVTATLREVYASPDMDHITDLLTRKLEELKALQSPEVEDS